MIFLALLFLLLPVQDKLWSEYQSEEYLYNIQSDVLPKDKTITEYKLELLNIARVELAKNINLQIIDKATLNKTSNEGRTSIKYQSNTEFITSLDINLMHTDTRYDKNTVSVIAYINKAELIQFELSQIDNLVKNAESLYKSAKGYAANLNKKAAINDANRALDTLDEADYAITILNVLGYQTIKSYNTLKESLKQFIDNTSKASSIYIVSDNQDFTKLVKGHLSTQGCNFVEKTKEADWIIQISAEDENYNSSVIGNNTFYYSYANASISITKRINNQTIFEDRPKSKGGSPLGYNQATQKAYEQLAKQLAEIIKEQIYL